MNQYRCESCKVDVHVCPVTKGYYDGTGMNISFRHYQKEFTSIVGCASHSDFQSEWDKVIVILNNLYTDCLFLSDGSLECNAMCDKVRGILEELRKGEQG